MSSKSEKISPTSSIQSQITFRDRPTVPGSWIHTKTPIKRGFHSTSSSPNNFGYTFERPAQVPYLRPNPIPSNLTQKFQATTQFDMATKNTDTMGGPLQGCFQNPDQRGTMGGQFESSPFTFGELNLNNGQIYGNNDQNNDLDGEESLG